MIKEGKTERFFVEADIGVLLEKDGQCRCMGCMELFPQGYDCCPNCGYFKDSKVENALHLYPGTILNDKYVVGKVIGYGGFGVTYLAWEILLQRKVAIKEYLPSDFSTRSAGQKHITIFSGEKSKQFKDGKDKFIDEAKRLAAFKSEQGIVTVYNCFEQNKTAYIVMEYLEGETLARKLDKVAAFSADEAIKLLMPVIDSLRKVHEEGIIHRDIAPDNIFITKKGDVKLIDFGASRHATVSGSRSLTVIIKPGYSAEEQYRSRGEQGAYTDVYSVGAVLYRMITGQTAPDAMERRTRFEKTGKDILVPMSKLSKKIDKSQENAICNAMNIRIDDRTPDMSALAKELLSTDEVKRRKNGIKKLDVLAWPLRAKIGIPFALAVLTVMIVLFVFGIIGPKTELNYDFVIPEGQAIVPNIVCYDDDEAVQRLEQFNLQYRIAEYKPSKIIGSGVICKQVPDAGSLTPVGAIIDIVVCSGLGLEYVEDFTGYAYEDAAKILTDLGFIVEKEEKNSKEYGEGIVFEQSVKNESFDKGKVITLTVAKGQKVNSDAVVEIPDVVGKTFDEAREILLGSNITIVKSPETVYDTSRKVGEIVKQSPAAGTSGYEGDKVTVVVNAGEKTVRVPDVVGLPEDEAKQNLETAGFKVNVAHGQSRNYANGMVFDQSVSAYTEKAPGTAVTITVSTGYSAEVPDVVGLELSEAQAAIRECGLQSMVPENGGYVESTSIKKGCVISQSEAPSTTISSDKVIYLVVSAGAPQTTDAYAEATVKPAETTVRQTERQTSPVTQQATQQAKAETYLVSFNPNGGTVSQASKTVTKGGTYGALPTPARNGYRFDGWQTTGGAYVDSSSSLAYNRDHELVAKWIENEYSDWSFDPPPSDVAKDQIDTRYVYRYYDEETMTSNSKVSGDGWILKDTTSTTSSSTWSKTKPEEKENRIIHTKKVDDTTTKTQYNYKRYKYYNKAENGYYHHYTEKWPTNHGYSGEWEYKVVDKELKYCGTYDGVKGYGSEGNVWYRADCNNESQKTVFKTNKTVVTGSHTEYMYEDTIYTYHYYRINGPTNWSETKPAEASNRTIETKIQYSYRPN